jgi:DNA repair protein RAD16
MQREEIRFMVERDGSAKAIVFSQFTSFLDLINYTLGKVISGETH